MANVRRRVTYKGKKARGRRKGGRIVRPWMETGILSPSVIAFGNEALREAFRVWWNPWWDMGVDFQKLTGAPVMGAARYRRATIRSGDCIELDRLEPRRRRIGLIRGRNGGRELKSTKSMAHVCIRLNYPLTEERTKVVAIDRRYPGEIFAHAHDFYRELYAEDKKRGGKPGPSSARLLNRGSGPLIWGHDIHDLVFEGCSYKAYPKPRKVEGSRRPVEGEFRFSIGS